MGSAKIFQRIYFLLSLLFSITIVCLPSFCAENYYADINIDVDSSGFVTIDGTTNYPELLTNNTQIYTTKEQNYWLLNITKENVFSDFIYTLTLPKGTSINYIKSSGFIRIEENQGNLLVSGFGENESFSVLVQYQVEKTSDNKVLARFDTVFIVLLIVIISLIVVLAILFVRDKKSKEVVEKTKLDEDDTKFKGLNERQKQIMKLLIDRKTPLTQTDIQKELNIPKAAVSRNIHGLERKGLIEKEQIGMSNLIRLKKL